jgi:tetratricopeptide (TPR) repeat protein
MTNPEEAENKRLEALSLAFIQALKDREAGKIDEALEALRDILTQEPRLPEPHLELGRILLDTDRLDDAEAHAREALTHLETGGQWTDDLPENVVKAIAHGLLAEVLRRKADEDDVIFGDADVFHNMVKESQTHFSTAAKLDPRDGYSDYYALFLGDPKTP